MKIDGGILTDAFANKAFFLLEVQAAFIDVRDQGDGLREIDVDGFVRRYILIIRIRDFNRAVFHTGGAARTFFFYNVPGVLDQGNLKVTYFPLYLIDFSKGKNLYIGVPADLDQFGCKNSHGAVVGRVGLVQLSHMAADGR